MRGWCDADMEELNVIDCVERVRARLIADLPDLPAELQRLRGRDIKCVSDEQIRHSLVAVALGIDENVPEGRREIRRQMAAIENSTDELATNGHLQSKIPRQLPVALTKRGSNANGNADASFAQRLSNCPNLMSAVSLVEQEFPFLRGRKTYAFLLSIGYPAATPAGETMRFLFRLGHTTEPQLNPHTRRSYFEKLTHLSRLGGVSLPELDYLFGLYSGARKVKGYKAPCGVQPRCAECTLSNFCAYVKHHPPKPMTQNVPIKDWAHEERPRERMLAGERLSSAELLAIILRTGTGTRSALDLGRELLHKFGTLHGIENASVAQITKVPGIGPAKAIEIKAAIELGRRVLQPAADSRDGLKAIGSSRDIFDMYRPRYKSATQEEFLLLALNTKNKLQREYSISVGTLNASIVHPRDVFKPALAEAAAGVVFVHNHPSGDPAPSPEDHALTRRLVEAGNILGIKVLDHVIIGAQRYFSFSDEGLLG